VRGDPPIGYLIPSDPKLGAFAVQIFIGYSLISAQWVGGGWGGGRGYMSGLASGGVPTGQIE
jgi:hypothetical protein